MWPWPPPLAGRCGSCESQCPSRDLSLTPRERIASYKELARLKRLLARSPEQELRRGGAERSGAGRGGAGRGGAGRGGAGRGGWGLLEEQRIALQGCAVV